MARLRTQEILLVHVEGRALRRTVRLVAVLVQEHGDAVAGEVLGAEGEFDGLVRGEEDGARAHRPFGLFALVAMFRGQDSRSEHKDLGAFGECFQRRISVVGVEVVEEGLQVGVAAGVVEDGDGGGVF